MSLLRAGLVGCGRVVEECHLPAYKALGDLVRATALADPNPARQAVVGEQLDIPAPSRFESYQAMLAHVPLDLVVIATPPDLHFAVCVAASGRSLAVICEKPLCLCPDQARALQHLVLEKQLFFSILHNYAYQPGWRVMAQAVRNGTCGKPLYLRYEERATGPWAVGGAEQWRTQRLWGGGPLWDSLYHAVYLSEIILGSKIVRSAASQYALSVPEPERLDTAQAVFEHACGAVTFSFCTWAHPFENEAVAEVVGEAGCVRYRSWDAPDRVSIVQDGLDRTLEAGATDDADGHKAAFDAALTALTRGEKSPDGIEAAVRIVQLLADSRKDASCMIQER